ncbi:MAG: hypothetical protein ABIA12_00040 [Candidatus Aenigmatarchaeota archaeon]
MPKAAVVGAEKAMVERELERRGFVLDKFKPDVVVSIGGDGSALVAEHLYPGVPRLTIKHSKRCAKCEVGGTHNLAEVIGKLADKKYSVVEDIKVEGSVGSPGSNDRTERLTGLNEINVAHALPTKAIRFDVLIDGRAVATDVIGDGVLVATPYGSTAYFRTITGRRFSKGLGVALNNANKKPKYRFGPDSAEVRIIVNRGPAIMCADNNTTMVQLADGDVVTVRKSKSRARIIELAGEERKVGL